MENIPLRWVVVQQGGRILSQRSHLANTAHAATGQAYIGRY
jgi:hypothetical protein